MHENKNFSSFYFELSDIVNSSFNLEEPISNSKVVRKILRSLLERFRPKVTIIEKSRDIDSLRVDEPVNSIQTYEVTLPSSQKSKDFTFKTSKNEEKYNKMPHNITRDGLAHMAERIKKVMKFNKKFYKNQESKKWKRPNEQSSKEKDKGSSKCKKIECFNSGGLGHIAIDYSNPKDIKKSMQTTWSDTDFEESGYTTSKDARYDPYWLFSFYCICGICAW